MRERRYAETFDSFYHGAISDGFKRLKKDISLPVRAVRKFVAPEYESYKRVKFTNDSITQIENKTKNY